jgi:hypothetical protein
MEITTIVATFAAFLMGGAAKGVVGMGLPTVALAILGTVLGLHEALPLLVVPAFLTNVWQAVYGGRFRLLLKRFWPMIVASWGGVWVGSVILFRVDPRIMNATLGVVLAFYALLGLTAVRFRVPAAREPYLTPLAGAATGIVVGTTGSLVMPVVPYFQALGLDKDTLVQAMGLSFATSSLALGIALAGHRSLEIESLVISTLALVPAMIGMHLGQWVRARILPETFRRWLFISLLILGANLVGKGMV